MCHHGGSARKIVMSSFINGPISSALLFTFSCDSSESQSTHKPYPSGRGGCSASALKKRMAYNVVLRKEAFITPILLLSHDWDLAGSMDLPTSCSTSFVSPILRAQRPPINPGCCLTSWRRFLKTTPAWEDGSSTSASGFRGSIQRSVTIVDMSEVHVRL